MPESITCNYECTTVHITKASYNLDTMTDFGLTRPNILTLLMSLQYLKREDISLTHPIKRI